MERVSAERAEVDTSKLDRTEIVGMVAAAILVISVFLEWYSLTTDPNVVQRGNDASNWACGVGNTSCSGWDTFPIVGVLLILADLSERARSRNLDRIASDELVRRASQHALAAEVGKAWWL